MELYDIIENSRAGDKSDSPKRANANGIYDVLRRYIQRKSNLQKLPAVSELSRKFGANYRTVKSALAMLETDGLISYEPNVGAVVNQKLAFAYVRWEGNAFNGALYDGVRRYCLEQSNVDLVIIDAHKNHQRVFDGIHAMADDVDGFILMPFEVEGYAEVLRAMAEQGKKIVQIDRILPDLNLSSVTTDDFGGAFQAVRHLLENHNRPVYFLGNSGTPTSSHNRYIGWQEAMRAYGFDTAGHCIDIDITERDSNVSAAEALNAEIYAAERLFDEHNEKIYCVFAANDIFASKICTVAKRRGFTIGKDVFIVGFGNMPLCENLEVKLTSVEQSPESLGYTAAKLLHSHLTADDFRPVHQVLPVSLIVRQSSVSA
jgi:DNA-binding LacI/PurR family transcriptional regulator